MAPRIGRGAGVGGVAVRAPAICTVLLLAGCNYTMAQQPRHTTYSGDRLWPNGAPALPPPDGSVAQDAVAQDAALTTPPPMTLALVQRGRERFDIYCSVCHGRDGEGHGPVVQRGFPAPPSYDLPRLRAAPASHVVDVITHGYGIMYSYADRVAPRDRWAIAAYVRALQLAHDAPVALLPAGASGGPQGETR